MQACKDLAERADISVGFLSENYGSGQAEVQQVAAHPLIEDQLNVRMTISISHLQEELPRSQLS